MGWVFFASGRKKMEFLISDSLPLQHTHRADFHSSLVEQFKISKLHDGTGIYETFHCTVKCSSVTYHTWKNKVDSGRAKKLTKNIFEKY